MTRSLFALLFCFIVALVGCKSSTTTGSGGDSSGSMSNAQKIVGNWTATKGDMPPGSGIEFTTDGNVVFHMNAKGKEIAVPAGTYKVDGDKIMLTAKKDGKEANETSTIKTLTNEVLVTVDSKGKVVEFKRMK